MVSWKNLTPFMSSLKKKMSKNKSLSVRRPFLEKNTARLSHSTSKLKNILKKRSKEE
jgi:hypothetical protein